MTVKSPLRVVIGRLRPKLWVLAFSLTRLGLATPVEDTPKTIAAKALDPSARRLADWAAKHRVQFSVTVATLPEGRHLVEHQAGVLRNPASVSKLITAYTALKTLGPSFRFKTRVHGQLLGGHIQRLVVRGEGDPSLSSGDVQLMASRLTSMGLAAIDEPIVVDQSYFDDSFVPPAFDQQPEEWAVFRAPVCATAVDGNRLVLWILPTPGCNVARLFVEPPGAAELDGQVRCVDVDTKAARVRMNVLPPRAERPIVRATGEVGRAESLLALDRRVDDPRKLPGYVLREALVSRGIKVAPTVSLGKVDELPVLYTHQSESLSQLLPRLGKASDNFAAEMLLKAIGAQATGGMGSSATGAAVVADTIAKLGTLREALRLVNGSGLFDANRATTDLLVRVLVEARLDRTIAPEYLAQLSIAGSDGTLANRLRQLPRGCSVRAKTGTLRNTISLAGFLGRPDGNELAFALLFEDVKEQASTRLEIDRYVQSLCTVPLSD